MSTGIGEGRVSLKREDRSLSSGAKVGKPLGIYGGEQIANLHLEGLVFNPLGEDEEGLELVLGSLVSPLREELDEHEASRPQGSASGGKVHRRLGSREEPGEIFKYHHSQSVGASDVIPFLRIAMPEQIEDRVLRADERCGSRLVLEALRLERFHDLSAMTGHCGFRHGDIDVLRQGRNPRLEPEKP